MEINMASLKQLSPPLLPPLLISFFKPSNAARIAHSCPRSAAAGPRNRTSPATATPPPTAAPGPATRSRRAEQRHQSAALTRRPRRRLLPRLADDATQVANYIRNNFLGGRSSSRRPGRCRFRHRSERWLTSGRAGESPEGV
ncbi:hypothetical protein ACSQ67_023980 [Phaseolus vulgaris]